MKETVEFPEKDESMGELIISFAGPRPEQQLERKVCVLFGVKSLYSFDIRRWMFSGLI